MTATAGPYVADARRVSSLVLTFVTLFYGVVFAMGFRDYARAEPGGFPVFYTAGKLARSNLTELYSQHLQNVFHPGSIGTGGYFYHLPYELAVLVPLSYLPQTAAFALWTAGSLLCLLGAALLLRRHFPAFDLFVPFAFAPTLILLVNGQDTAFLVLLTAIAFDLFVQGRDMCAGAILALGLFKFPFVLPVVVILGLRHRRMPVGFGAVSVLLLALCFMLIWRRGGQEYLSLTHAADTLESPAMLSNLRGVVGVVTGSSHPWLVIAISVGMVALAAFLKADRIPLFCVAMIVAQLVSYHAHAYDGVYLLVPMAWMYRSSVRWLRWLPALLLLATPVLLIRPPLAYLLAVPLCGFLALIFIPSAAGEILRAKPTNGVITA